MPTGEPIPARPARVLLYDGECGLCKTTVRWLLDHDPRARLSFAPQHSAAAQKIFARHGLSGSLETAVLVSGLGTPEETLATHSDAILGCLTALGGVWGVLAAVARVVPRPLRDAAYRLLARHRIGLFGTGERCRLPTPAERARFLDA